ncbi:Ribosome recycling factor [hydrothermal vent metagenome]|uniref:Ribosome recycling factor n=1 Tax=hydrothermal vent metagenome TaxID=652676 RepID=A0A3B1BWV0_9ZZZZ
MVEKIFGEVKHKMEVTVEHLARELAGIRTGRASLALLDGIHVDYYGVETPLNQVANLSLPDSLTISVQPWDTSMTPAIEKAILASDLGLTPSSDGKIIRIPIPPLTEERRKELVKVVRKTAEEAKIAIRNVRRDGVDSIKKKEKAKEISEDESHTAADRVQKITDEFIGSVSALEAEKEKEVMDK